MNPGLKMILATREREGERMGWERPVHYPRDRTYNGSEMPYTSGGRDMEREPMEEMRRRRDRRGRFMTAEPYDMPSYDNEGERMRPMAKDRRMDEYPRQRPMMNIGFASGEDAESMIAFPNHERSGNRRMDHRTAEAWVSNMTNEDGTKGPHWKMEQTEQVRKQKNLDCDPVEFWVAMNAAYSDLAKIAKKYNVNNMDFYVDFAKAFWLHDQDAVEHKLSAYYEAVVEK